MTIVVGAASPDGIVLAADSRSTQTWAKSDRHRIATDAAEKVFNLGDKFAVATYGTAMLGGQTINGAMNEFIASKVNDCPAVEDCANELDQFFTQRFKASYPKFVPTAGASPLGFIVAGYDGAGIGHVYEVQIFETPAVTRQFGTDSGGTLWRGQTDVVRRLVKGVDWDELLSANPSIDPPLGETMAKLEYILINPHTLTDAADLAAFLVRTTIDMQRFSDGTSLHPGLIPGCGGDMQLLAATSEGTRWLKRRGTWSSPDSA
jgi:hypothetical protein